VLFFCLIAFAATHSLWISPDRQVFFAWGIPALVWLVAFMAVVDAISPRPGRQWTGFVVSGAFGLIAVLAGALIFHHGKYSPSDSFFPLLMAFLSLLSSIISVHEGKKKVRNVPASHVC
jgi:predicted membrane channel-forming protein YqfA (hemolysin III family)